MLQHKRKPNHHHFLIGTTMKKIDKIAIYQIIEKKSRQFKRIDRWDQVRRRLGSINMAFSFLQTEVKSRTQYRSELLKYIPIGLVACIQGYFNLAIRDLIDSGPPFSQNATSFKDLHFKIEAILEIQGRKVTLGEIIAHLQSLNSLDSLHSSMTTILGEDFHKRLKEIVLSGETGKFGEFAYLVFPLMKRVFRLRHIYCHELSSAQRLKIKTIDDCSLGVAIYLYSTELLIQKLTNKK